MRYGSRSLVVSLAVLAALFSTAALSRAATCKLTSKKVDSGQRVYRPSSSSPDWLFTFTESQDVSVYLEPKTVDRDGKKATSWTPSRDPGSEQFGRTVKKQLEKYNAEFPFRGMVQLGDKQYAFVLDAPEPGGQGYGLLYFDANGNGELTDDGVIESLETQRVKKARARAEKEAKELAEREKAEKARADSAKKSATRDEEAEKDDETEKDEEEQKDTIEREVASARAAARYPTNHRFPAVDVAIEADGKKVNYRFFMTAYSYFRDGYGRVSASITPGMYQEGEIKLDGRRQRVVLVDYNSNGRFDDVTKITEARMSQEGPARYYPQRGDVLFLDPKPVEDASAIWDTTGLDFRHNVEKLVSLRGRYYRLMVSPAGDEVSIEPADVAMGYVTSPHANYSAILYGDSGLLRIDGVGDKPVEVPEGTWRVVSYKIDLTDVVTAEEKKKEEEAKKTVEAAKTAAGKTETKDLSFWTAINKAVKKKAAARRVQTTKTTLVTAMGTTAGKPVKVVKGQTAALAFGPPYKPVVESPYFNRSNDTLYLALEIYGSDGEAVTDLRVKGGRAEKPAIKILGPDGKVASEGHFEYG